MVIPPRPLRPVVVCPEVSEPTLFLSFSEAVTALGEGWGEHFRSVFMSGVGIAGVWAVPHPDAGAHPDAVAFSAKSICEKIDGEILNMLTEAAKPYKGEW